MATKINILIPLANKLGKKVFLEETTYEFCPELWNIIKDYLFGNKNDKLLFLIKANNLYEHITIEQLTNSNSFSKTEDYNEEKAFENAYYKRVVSNKIPKIEAFENMYKIKRWRIIIDRKIIEYKRLYRNTYYIGEKGKHSRTGEEVTRIYLKNDEFNYKTYIASNITNIGDDNDIKYYIDECKKYRLQYEKLMNIIS